MKKPFTRNSALFTFLATFFYAAASFGQTTITTGVLAPTTVCQGGNVAVNFKADGTIPLLTTYEAQLSDETGAFAAKPLVVGTSDKTPIEANIPVATPAGAAYKIRVVSILAGVIKTEGTESAALKINAIPAAPVVTSPVNVEQDKAATLTATGTGLKWYDTAVSAASSATKPVPDTETPGSKSYFVSQTVGGCESERAEIVVTVTACTPPDAPVVANVNQQVGDDEKLLTATGTGLKWYAAKTGGSPLAGAPTTSTDKESTKSYFVSQTVGGCESDRAEIVVKVSACTPPDAPKVENVSYTIGDKATALSATPATGLLWYTSANGGTGSATAPIPSTTAAGTKSYYVSRTVNKCESARAEIIVTVSACTPPDAPQVENVSYTVDDKATALSATPATGLLWYTAANGGTGSATAPIPSTTAAGTKSYYVSRTVNKCESARAEIVVTVSACVPPATPKVEDITYCFGEPTEMLTAVGKGLKWYENAFDGTGSNVAPKPSNTIGKSYFVSQTIGVCESARAEIKVTINQVAKPAVSAPTYAYCLGSTPKPLAATGSNLRWYTGSLSGSGSITAPSVITTKKGSTKYLVTQTINGCTSEPAEIVVTVSDVIPPVPITKTTLEYCVGDKNIPALTATGKNLTWYSSAGAELSGAPTPLAEEANDISYFVTQTLDICESSKQEIKVKIKATSEIPTLTSDDKYCARPGNTKPLVAKGVSILWYDAAGKALSSAPSPSTSKADIFKYFITQTEAKKCESPKEKGAITITINPTPANLPSLTDSLFCQVRKSEIRTLSVKASGENSVNWFDVNGKALESAPTVDLAIDKTNIFYATQETINGCESPEKRIQKVRVKPLPALPTIDKPLIEYCQFIKADPLAATPMAKATLDWFGTNASGGTASDTPPTPSTAEGGHTSYYVAQTLEGCLGDRAKIDVKINTTPKPATKTYLEFCQGETAPILDATGTVLKWYRTVDGEWQGFPFTPFTDKVQDYSFYVTQTGLENKCESPKEEIKIHIKSLPSATISGNSTIDLGNNANINLKFTGDGPWIFALSDGTTDTTDQANHQVQVSPSTTTSYLITEVSNACGKGVPLGSAMVTVKIPTINSGNPSVAEACAGKTFIVPFQQSGDFPTENSFKLQIASENQDSKFFTIPSVATRTAVTATFPDTTKGGSYYLRVISSGENPDFLVKGSVSSITISASPLPIATLSGPQTILVGEKATLKVETTGKAPWTFRLDNGTKDTLITASVSPYTFQIAPPATVTYTISAVTNSCGTGKGAGSARVQVDPILGVEPQQPTDWVKVYPTLVQSVCTVEVTGNIKLKQASVEVIDLNGRSRGKKLIEQKNTEVDFSRYPSGLYLLRIQNGNLSTVQRVMKP